MPSKENREQSRTESMEGTEPMLAQAQKVHTITFDGVKFDQREVYVNKGDIIEFKLKSSDVERIGVYFEPDRFLTQDGYHQRDITVVSEGTLLEVSPASEAKKCTFTMYVAAVASEGRLVNVSPAESEHMDGSFGTPGTSRSHPPLGDGATGKIIINGVEDPRPKP